MSNLLQERAELLQERAELQDHLKAVRRAMDVKPLSASEFAEAQEDEEELVGLIDYQNHLLDIHDRKVNAVPPRQSFGMRF